MEPRFFSYQDIIHNIILDEIKELELSGSSSAVFNSWELIKYIRGIQDEKGEEQKEEMLNLEVVYPAVSSWISSGKKVLEIGCRYGILSAILSEAEQNIVCGVDVNDTNIYIAEKLREHLKRENLSFIGSDIFTLEAVNEKFDYLVCMDILSDFLKLKSEKDLIKYINFLFQFLHENGTLIIYDSDIIFGILEKYYRISAAEPCAETKMLFSCRIQK